MKQEKLEISQTKPTKPTLSCHGKDDGIAATAISKGRQAGRQGRGNLCNNALPIILLNM